MIHGPIAIFWQIFSLSKRKWKQDSFAQKSRWLWFWLLEYKIVDSCLDPCLDPLLDFLLNRLLDPLLDQFRARALHITVKLGNKELSGRPKIVP